MNAIYFQPLFDEQKCSYRFSYCLSEMLKQRNIVLDRPDYRGMGDSEGLFSNVTLETIRQDLDSLISKRPEILIGLRFGASLICDYLARNQFACRRIVLIEPIFDGRNYVEYLQRKQRLKDHLSKLPTDFHQEEGYINLEGYKTKRCFIDQIRSFTSDSIHSNCFGGNRINILFTRSRISVAENQIISRLKKHNPMDVVDVQFPDIWERIPQMDYSPLIEQVVGWCNEE